ncbi:MAG: transporter substrate-binding domain-containing protein [Nostocaceae cyanobacterium]|nr:transporter substrate-binding domain-containing protein [Nostocaceae cyanobacterium]
MKDKGKRIIIFLLAFAFLLLPFSLPSNATELAKIQQRGYLNIAVKDNLRPLAFKDGNGNLQGLEIDLARRLAEDLLGKADAVKLQPVTNRDRLKVVLEHKVDIAIARVTATASRARLVSFSVPYYFDGAVVLTKDTAIQKLTDLSRRKIAILKGASTIASVRYAIPEAELVGVDSYQEGRSLLENNTASAFAADTSVLTGWVQEYPQYRILATKLSTQPLSIVMPKGLQYDELRRNINQALARYLSEGWLQERSKNWGLLTGE